MVSELSTILTDSRLVAPLGLLVVVSFALNTLFRRGRLFNAKPSVAAHSFAMQLIFLYSSSAGLYIWLTDPMLADPNFDRLWGEHEGARSLAFVMAAAQLYDLPASIFVSDLWSLTFVVHHAVTLILAVSVLRYGVGFYFVVYFFGVIELSSPWLAVVDLCRDFPRLSETVPVLNECARIVFAVTFFAVRVLGWLPVTVDFWRHVLPLIFAADASQRRDVPRPFLALWLAISLFLTVLQLKWGHLIARALYLMLIGDASEREKEAKGA